MTNLFEFLHRETPMVNTLEDLEDPRGYNLAKENFVRITDVPGLYFELEQAGTKSKIECSNSLSSDFNLEDELITSSEALKLYNQVIARAILNYELTQRKKFNILIDQYTYTFEGMLGGIIISRDLYKTFIREGPIRTYQQIADNYVEIAEMIHQHSETYRY